MTKRELAKLKKYSREEIIERLIELQAKMNSLSGLDAESKDPSSIERTKIGVERYKLELVLNNYKTRQTKRKIINKPRTVKPKTAETKPVEPKKKKGETAGEKPVKPKKEKEKKEKEESTKPNPKKDKPIELKPIKWEPVTRIYTPKEEPIKDDSQVMPTEKSKTTVEYSIGTFRAFLLKIIRKIRSIVKKGAFLDNALGGLEKGLLKGAKQTLLKPAKNETIAETNKDIKWFAERTKIADSLENRIFKEELTKVKMILNGIEEKEQKEKLDKIIKESNIPQITKMEDSSSIESKIIDVSIYNASKVMLEKAKKEGIELKDSKGKNRTYKDIIEEYKEKIELRRRTTDIALFGVAGDSERKKHEDMER